MRRSDSIRNNCGEGPRSRITMAQTSELRAASAAGLRAETRPPGTEFLDAETGCQKSPLKRTNAHRDKNPGMEWPEIRAETPYLASYRKRAVCGDWMVVCAVRYEPVSTSNSLIRAVLQGIFRKIRGFAQQRLSVAQSFQTLGRKFPGEASREFFRASREAAGNTFAKTGNLLWRDFIAGRVIGSITKTLELFCSSSDAYARY